MRDRWKAWLRSLLSRFLPARAPLQIPPPPPPMPPIPPEPIVTTEPPQPKPKPNGAADHWHDPEYPEDKQNEHAEYSGFYFRSNILDQLDRYMHYLRRMKNHDRQTYEIYSRIGGRITSMRVAAHRLELEPSFLQTKPAFGCFALSIGAAMEKKEKETHKMSPRFVYFTKYKEPPPGIQRANAGAIYLVTAYFDGGDSLVLPVIFPVLLHEDGTVEALRMLMEKPQTIQGRRGAYRGYGTTITHQRWGINPHVIAWAEENKMAPVDMMRFLFVWCANCWTLSHGSMIRVAATSTDGITAAFGVDMLRTPYFFKDRDRVITDKGKTARIFHVVRPHMRATRRGSIGVKMHFAGLRVFRWNGYEVRISVPGLDHADPFEVNFGSFDAENAPKGEKMVGTEVMARWLARHMRNGWKNVQRSRAASR